MRIGQLNQKRRTIPINIDLEDGTESLSITYRPSAYTPALAAQVRELSSSHLGEHQAIVVQLAAIVESWDLEDGDGHPYPLTIEALSQLPSQFLSTVLSAIGEDSVPGKTTGETSGAT